MTDSVPFRPRLRVPLLIVAVAFFLYIIPAQVATRTMTHFLSMVAGPILGTLVLFFWWVFFSGIRGRARWLVPVVFLVPLIVFLGTLYRLNPLGVLLFGMPVVAFLGIAWLVVSERLAWAARVTGTIVTILLGWGLFSLVRIDQTSAELSPEIRFFWNKNAETLFNEERARRLADAPPAPAPSESAAPISVTVGDWAEFRGPNRDSVLTGVTVRTDWDATPPKLLWKQRVGPGWGSFSVVGDRLFTMEQREANEAVVCYAAETGKEIWEKTWPSRFYEGMAGPGPRSTPTILDGNLYAYGATGTLVCLDAATGREKWKRNVAEDTGATVPIWGFSSSPLVCQGIVVVFAGAPEGKGTAAYKAATGEPLWQAGDGLHGYSSGHVAKIGGVEQILMVSDYGMESFRHADGVRLWTCDWLIRGQNRVTQPIIVGDSDVILGTGVGDRGIRRFHVTKTGDTFATETVWTSKGLRPYFNDAIVYKDHLYGFDDDTLACVALKDGKQKWSTPASTFGHGQVLLLADQGLLLVQGVDGKVSLVEATPEEYSPVTKFAALKGKTWNHPVVARGRLYVRNGVEAACYDLK